MPSSIRTCRYRWPSRSIWTSARPGPCQPFSTISSRRGQGAGRRFLLGELQLAEGPEADFPLICAGAFNPVGRIRVAEAVDYFEAHVARHPDARGLPGLTIDDVTARSAEFTERMRLHGMLGTGTTGVQGAAPKYLLTRDRAGLLHGDAGLPDAEATRHLIAKLPRGKSAADEKVLRNEAAYMRVAAALGIRTHAELPTLHGDVLLIPRFDRIARDGKVVRLHQESVASILGLSGFDRRPSLFEVVAGIRDVVTDPAAETLEFIKRDVLNLAMRNTDNLRPCNSSTERSGSRPCSTSRRCTWTQKAWPER